MTSLTPKVALLACVLFWSLLSVTARGDLPAFEQLPPLPNPVGLGGPIVGTHKGVLLVAGGANFPVPLAEGGAKIWHDRVYALLPGESSWLEAGILPNPLAYAACASSERGVVIIGGSDADAVHAQTLLMRWDSASAQVHFERLPDLPAPSAFGSAEVIDGGVYVMAGKRSKDDADVHGGFWRLDIDAAERGWSMLPGPPGTNRFKMLTAAQQDAAGEMCLYLFSGSRTSTNEDGEPRFEMFTDTYRYSPSQNAWTRLADLPTLDDPRDIPGEAAHTDEPWPISAGCAMTYGDAVILTFSGSTGRHLLDEQGKLTPPTTRPPFAPRVLSYNVKEDFWHDVGRMPIGVVTTRAAVWNERIVVPSGETRPGERTPAVQALPLPTAAGNLQQGQLAALDYAVLGVYLALMVGVGVYFAWRERSTEEYFLASGRIPWWAAGLSIFGTQLSAITFMAIPATAYGSDWRRFVGQLMLLPIFVIVIYAFLPFFRRLNITTAYEYLEDRFSLSLRLAASGLFILFQFGRMSIVVLLPALALSAVTGMNSFLCIGVMGLLATTYTALGGISAVIWTDVLQVFVLIGGALLCLVVAIVDAGGVGQALDIATAADRLHMFDWRWSLSDLVAWVLIVGFLFTNIVPYTTDQTVIQRYLTTPDEKDAARSLWLNLLITLPTGLLFYGLGTALFAYYTTHPAEQAALPESADQLVPWFVVTQLPAGLAGVVVAGIFAAAMSSLDSSMNSITTAVVHDFVGRLGSRVIERDQLRLARTLTVVFGLIGTGVAMLLATYEIKYLFDFFQKIIGLFGGGVTGVFVLAIFTRRANAVGAMVGLLAGAVVTITAAYFTNISFLLYAALGCVTCLVFGYLASAMGGGHRKDLAGLTLWTRQGTRQP